MIFGENRKKKKKETGKSGMFGFLRRSKEHPRRDIALRRNVGLPRRDEAEGPKAPPRATLRHRHCSLRENFGFLFRKSRIRTPIV